MKTYASIHYAPGDRPTGRINLEGLANLKWADEPGSGLYVSVADEAAADDFVDYLDCLIAVASELALRIRAFQASKDRIDTSQIETNA